MSLWKHRYLSTHKVTIYSHHKTDEILLFWTYIGCTFSRCWQCRSFDAVMNLVMETRQTKPADSAIVAELFAYSRWVLSPGPPPATENFMQQQTSSGKKKRSLYWHTHPYLLISCSLSRLQLLARIRQGCSINSQCPFIHCDLFGVVWIVAVRKWLHLWNKGTWWAHEPSRW